MLQGKTIAVDFDGTLNQYHGWTRGEPIPAPLDGAREFLRQLAVEAKARVIIYTCRELGEVWDWLEKNEMVEFVACVTAQKPVAFAYVDDRAITFRGSYGETLQAIHDFKAWWEKESSHLLVGKENHAVD